MIRFFLKKKEIGNFSLTITSFKNIYLNLLKDIFSSMHLIAVIFQRRYNLTMPHEREPKDTLFLLVSFP